MSTIKSSAENLTLNADGANNDIKFQSNGSEVASIDQAGTVTATTFTGAATDATKLPLSGGSMTGNLVVGGGAAPRVSITSNNANGSAAINFLSTTNNSKNWEVGSNLHNSDGLEFTPSTANGGSTFTTPTVSFPIAGGITFGSDTAAANALDDYEEGTWTPVIGSSNYRQGTWSSAAGFYTKVGNMVSLHIGISGSGMYLNNATAYQYITGIPFAADMTNITTYSGGWSGDSVTKCIGGSVYLNSVAMYLHCTTPGWSTTGVDGIGVSITYRTTL